ncbi:MAG: aldolase/citrate lyase family protein [Betaproteobacteria bacterium]
MTVTASIFRRPVALRRSWLFTAGLDPVAHQRALESGADVVVADLEEFTAVTDRPQARQNIVELLAACKAHMTVGAVRINLLANDGLEDLAVVMRGAPDAVFLPTVESAAQIKALDDAISAHEVALGMVPGSTEIVPTLESALGIVRAQEILNASPRVSACLLAAEDLTADLGAERGPDSTELNHLRARFLVDCVAARRVAIDCPFNYRGSPAQMADLVWARRIGLKAKCAVFPEQVALIHGCLTPDEATVRKARSTVARFEAQRRAAPDPEAAAPVDPPDFHTARRLLARHDAFQNWAAVLQPHHRQGAIT